MAVRHEKDGVLMGGDHYARTDLRVVVLTFAGSEVEVRKVQQKMSRYAVSWEVHARISELLKCWVEHSDGQITDWSTRQTRRSTCRRCREDLD